MAASEELRQIAEESDRLVTQYFEAIKKGWATTAHHLTDRLLDLGVRDEFVQRELQAMAGEGTQDRVAA